jgi:hypothetical protein
MVFAPWRQDHLALFLFQKAPLLSFSRHHLPFGSRGTEPSGTSKSPSAYSAVYSHPLDIIILQWHTPTSFLATGFSNRHRCTSLLNFPKGSKSQSSTRLLAVKTNTARFGIEVARVGWIAEMRFLARRSVCNRSERGKFPNCWISLSVKSIPSCGYCQRTTSKLAVARSRSGDLERHTPAIPRFSIVGILWPSRLNVQHSS